MKDLSVIIVTYNSQTHIRDCIAAVKDSLRLKEVIVVDNDSTDNSVSIAMSIGADQVLQNPANVGFGRAVNIGAASASGKYLLLLNPDCRVSGLLLDEMASWFDEEPDVGVLAPALVHPSGIGAAWSAGYFPTIRASASHALALGRIPYLARLVKGFQLYPNGEHESGFTDVDWVSGACLMTTRKIFEQLGGISEHWFMYAEDIDYCMQVRGRGFRVVHGSTYRATHEIAGSSGVQESRKSALWLINLEDLYVRRVGIGLARWPWRAVWVAGLLARACLLFVASLAPRPLSRREDQRRSARRFYDFGRDLLLHIPLKS